MRAMRQQPDHVFGPLRMPVLRKRIEKDVRSFDLSLGIDCGSRKKGYWRISLRRGAAMGIMMVR